MSLVENGLIHLYVGDGKGKTTAALGLAMRALGAGEKIFFAQFLKGRESSEIVILKRLGIDVIRTDGITKFSKDMNEEEKKTAKALCQKCLEQIEEAVNSNKYGLIVCDEVVDAINLGFIDTDEFLSIINKRKSNTEIVMTGRNPNDKIVDAADYLTVMSALKHPYRKGIKGRLGIEY